MTVTAVYPNNVQNGYSQRVNFLDVVEDVDVNNLQVEITAIETYVGANPHISSGWVGSFTSSTTSWPSLASRVQNIEYGLYEALNSQVNANGLIGTTLSSNVVSSSLTSLGTLTSLTVSGTTTSGSYAGDGSGLSNLQGSSLGIMNLMGAL